MSTRSRYLTIADDSQTTQARADTGDSRAETESIVGLSNMQDSVLSDDLKLYQGDYPQS